MKCQKNGFCVVRDDITVLEDAIRNAEFLIFSTPTRWGNISALMLKCFERLFGFLIQEVRQGFPKKMNANGKKAILVTSCSTPFPFNIIFNQSSACFSRLKEICNYSGIKVIKTIVLPGTLEMQEVPQKYFEKAEKVGKAYFSCL